MTIVACKPDSVGAGFPEEHQWRSAMKTAIRDGIELCQRLGLPMRYEAAAARASRQFPVFAPHSYVARIQPGNPADPLLRQVLPLAEEMDEVAGYSADPVDDLGATILPGMIQKYAGRVLLITTGACAIHCRYCFRRQYPYAEGPRTADAWDPTIEKLAEDASIDEVLLSGGDPLTMVDSVLRELVFRLAGIEHLKRIRIHTRLPVVIPERVTKELISWLRGTRLTPIVVVHANHAAELNEDVAAAFSRLIDAGIPLLNQSVLLHGVNDNLTALQTLFRRLVDLRVTPYYLHQLDRVTGAAHFEVPIPRGQELIGQLRESLPGYMVPRYVQDIPGHQAKRILA